MRVAKTMESFWQKLPQPFFVLAPMADVTDAAYRRLIASLGKPHILWTEFVSADGLFHTREIQKIPDAENPLMRDLSYTDAERPIVAQIFSSDPEKVAYAASLVANLGFDGIDLNMGCPDRSIEKQGAGAALIKNPTQAAALIVAAKEGAARGGNRPLPVSVKTRIGYFHPEIDTWIRALLAAEPAAITVHLRTRKEMSKVPAHWELMEKIVALRNHLAAPVLLLGNGDVRSLAEAREKARVTGVDGVMLGRAVFGNPWLFCDRAPEETTPAERLAALLALARSFEDITPPKSFSIFKKHIKAFVHGFPGAGDARKAAMETTSAHELAIALQPWRDILSHTHPMV